MSMLSCGGQTQRTGLRIVAILLGIAFLTPSSRAASKDQSCDVRADYSLGVEDYPTAIILHRKLLQSNPNNALAHYHLGFAYAMVGDPANEINEYVAAVRLGLDQWDLFMNLGLAYLEQDAYGKAIGVLQIAVLLGPDHPETHFNLALAYERNSRLPEALREISASLRLSPEGPDGHNMNAIIYAELGDQVSARGEWVHLLEIDPDYAPARANLAILDGSTMSGHQHERRTEGSPFRTELADHSLSR
jgi:Flp pilus assembly protein TadD